MQDQKKQENPQTVGLPETQRAQKVNAADLIMGAILLTDERTLVKTVEHLRQCKVQLTGGDPGGLGGSVDPLLFRVGGQRYDFDPSLVC